MTGQLSFTIPEILSLVGLIQCVYVLVYMVFRAGDIRRAALPFLYFFVLGLAFLFDFARDYLGESFDYYLLASWFAWFMGPPLSVLLIIQVTQITKWPDPRNFWLLLLTPLAGLAAFFLSRLDHTCSLTEVCPIFEQWLVVLGLGAGLASIVAIWTRKNIFKELRENVGGKERYWLVLTLIFVNLAFLALMLLSLTPLLKAGAVMMIRTFLGLGLVYLTGSSLFRIYPQSLQLVERKKRENITDEETLVARKIEDLLALDKIYQEPSYNRADLARELNMTESTVSRIINLHFGKSLPQLLNEKRVADAQRLLQETASPVKDVAEQVGFNSVASFNRVFREITGMTPTASRNAVKKSAT